MPVQVTSETNAALASPVNNVLACVASGLLVVYTPPAGFEESFQALPVIDCSKGAQHTRSLIASIPAADILPEAAACNIMSKSGRKFPLARLFAALDVAGVKALAAPRSDSCILGGRKRS